MGWAGLPRVNDTRGLSDVDADLVAELRAVLVKWHAEGRIGLTLLHSHFDLDDDELLVETVDHESRICTVQPLRADTIPDHVDLVATTWRLDASDGLPRAVTYCYRNGEFHMR